jgi:DNA-binding CsgD family transcriptional regulator
VLDRSSTDDAEPESGISDARRAGLAYLALEGMTNPQIGARLFLSPRTVEWHLRHVYDKLGITSRRELRSASVRFT